MAQIIIEVNDNIANDVRDVLCNKWGYQSGNKMTFLKTYIAAWVKKEYREQKAEEAITVGIHDIKATSLASTANADIQ